LLDEFGFEVIFKYRLVAELHSVHTSTEFILALESAGNRV